MADSHTQWNVGVDIGGTFTDIVLWDSAGARLIIDKVLTTPDDPSRAVLDGVRQVLNTAGISAKDLSSVIHGTTLVANALIERKGVTTGLITTAGFRDVLEIGREWRYDLFDLDIEMPAPLVPRPLRHEAQERIGPDGAVITALDTEALRPVIRQLREAGVHVTAQRFDGEVRTQYFQLRLATQTRTADACPFCNGVQPGVIARNEGIGAICALKNSSDA